MNARAALGHRVLEAPFRGQVVLPREICVVCQVETTEVFKVSFLEQYGTVDGTNMDQVAAVKCSKKRIHENKTHEWPLVTSGKKCSIVTML